jgi:hypothetical protein
MPNSECRHSREIHVSKLILALIVGLFVSVAHAEPAAASCEAQAVGKDGKPLAGAAKAAFIKKCNADGGNGASCEAKAVSKAGKPLAGAAKDKFMKKCLNDAAA